MEANVDSWDSERPMGNHETQILIETNGNSSDSEILLETHETNGESWDLERAMENYQIQRD